MCLHATVINAAQPEQNLNCHLSQVLLLCQQFCYYANSVHYLLVFHVTLYSGGTGRIHNVRLCNTCYIGMECNPRPILNDRQKCWHYSCICAPANH